MKLALFFTYNISLEKWVTSGLFDREKLLYEKLLSNKVLSKISWLTYGSKDALLAQKLHANGKLHHDIEVIAMPWFFKYKPGAFIYSLLMPVIQKKTLRAVDILKTNQMAGSWTAVLAKWIFGKPLIARSGFTWSMLKEKDNTAMVKLKLITAAERFAFKNATVSVVTSKSQRHYICERYNLQQDNISVIPNYIDTMLFKPDYSENKYNDRVIYIGRLSKEKNLFNLIEAVAKTGITLDILGTGPLVRQLQERAQKCAASVNFLDIVPNDQVPAVLNKYQYYVLPSFSEAMPKTLLEAMACGLICITTNTESAEEIIGDGVDGFIAKGTSPEILAQTIKKAIETTSDTIRANAVAKIKSRFSLDKILEKESQIIKEF